MSTDSLDFYLEAARVVDRQVSTNPGLGIPVDPDVAEHMGAMEDEALVADLLDDVEGSETDREVLHG